MTRLTIPTILCGIVFLIPLNILVIGDWLGSGTQWAWFRYQQTYLGSNFIFINRDLNYVLDGLLGWKTGISVGIWISGLIFLILALLVSYYLQNPEGIRHAGILLMFGGVTFILSDCIQYGLFLEGPAGICIPIGIPIIFVIGWLLYTRDWKTTEQTEPRKQSPLSFWLSVKTALTTLFNNNTALCLFLIFYFAYNTIFVANAPGDTVPATFLPISILQYHNLVFDQFGQMAINSNTYGGYLLINNHQYSLFPVVTPVFVTPIYAVSLVFFHLFSIPLNIGNIILISKTSASIITALSCVFVYLTSKELFSKRIALVSTFIYAFATSTWSISSQALWQQGMGELLLILMLWCIVRNEKNTSIENIVLLGILSGLFVFNRPPDALLIIPIVYYVIRFYRNHSRYYALAGFVSGLPFLLYNLLIFGTVFGGYSHDFHQYVFNGDFVIHYAGLLVSPNVGLFIFTPVLFFSIFGYFKLKNLHNPHVASTLSVFAPVILLTILAYSFFNEWYTEWCYGPRYLTVIVPILILYCAFFFDDLAKSPPNRLQKNRIAAILILLIAASVIIQFIGVYYYVYLPSKGMDDQRAWDWNDSIIAGSFNAGFGKTITITMYSFAPLPPILRYQFMGGG